MVYAAAVTEIIACVADEVPALTAGNLKLSTAVKPSVRHGAGAAYGRALRSAATRRAHKTANASSPPFSQEYTSKAGSGFDLTSDARHSTTSSGLRNVTITIGIGSNGPDLRIAFVGRTPGRISLGPARHNCAAEVKLCDGAIFGNAPGAEGTPLCQFFLLLLEPNGDRQSDLGGCSARPCCWSATYRDPQRWPAAAWVCSERGC